ncbi:U2 snRNP complex subunit msl1 [Sarracenia purpurea var. burkii]
MASIRCSILKSLCSSINHSSRTQSCRRYGCYSEIAKTSFAHISPNHLRKESTFNRNYVKEGLESLASSHHNRNNFTGSSTPKLLSLRVNPNFSPTRISPVLNYRLYSSFFDGQGDRDRNSEVPAASGAGEPSSSESGVGGSDWVEMAKDAWKSVEEKAKEASNELAPHAQQLLDAHPYLRDVIVPISFTLTSTVLAWVVLPKLLRRFHKYSMQGPAELLSGTSLWGPVPYEKSFWGALDDPLRYLITFMAFSKIAVMVAPTTIASQYITQVWRGAVIVSFVWFLHRWKTNVFARALAARNISGVERETLLTLDKISSVGLFVIGLMALAEACGVPVQSILTVGGIGGVATAFAARDILGNVLSGLSVQISRPFSIGETIKAGSVEGQVVEMGLTTTSLLSAEKFPVIVPNSMFSSQVIVNKSRAPFRALITKIPFQTDDLLKIPLISEDIKRMLRSNPKVYLETEPPFCFLSRIEKSYAELSLGCNLKHMSKDEFYSTEQDILLQSVLILKQHGATLGCTQENTTCL